MSLEASCKFVTMSSESPLAIHPYQDDVNVNRSVCIVQCRVHSRCAGRDPSCQLLPVKLKLSNYPQSTPTRGVSYGACLSSAFSSESVRSRQNPLIARRELSCRSCVKVAHASAQIHTVASHRCRQLGHGASAALQMKNGKPRDDRLQQHWLTVMC